jgi:CDP-glycerol glycerophosphotransferase (TagB/SpsB family)
MMNEMYRSFSLTRFYFNTIAAAGKIKFCYVFNDLTFAGRIITDIAKQKGIKTFYIMHGLLSDEFIENLHVCDNYLVFGDYVRDILAGKEGIQQHQIFTFGAPYLNYFIKQQEPEIFTKEVKAKIPKDKKVAIMLLTGPGHSVSAQHHHSIIEAIKEIIKEKSDSFYFIFKLHPKDKVSNFSSLFEDEQLRKNFKVYAYNKLDNAETIFDWLKVADVVITGASSTALEGMYMGKPIITLDLMHSFDNHTLFITEGGTYHCTNKEELLDAINFVADNNFKTKAKADEMAKNYFSDASKLSTFYSGVMDSLIS